MLMVIITMLAMVKVVVVMAIVRTMMVVMAMVIKMMGCREFVWIFLYNELFLGSHQRWKVIEG